MKKTYIAGFIILFCFCIFVFFLKTNKVFTFKKYNNSGKLIGLYEYIIKNGNPIQQGKFTNFNDNGVKIAEGNFLNNEPNGICFYYYDNGKIESTQFKKTGKITEESTFYNYNGLIRKYIFYNTLGEAYFIIDFDEKGVREYHGSTIKEIYQCNIKNDLNLKVGDVLKYSYVVANIPNSKRSVKIENIGVDSAKSKRTIKRLPSTRIDVKEILTKRGKNTIKAIVQYEFDDKITNSINDTITFNINVK